MHLWILTSVQICPPQVFLDIIGRIHCTFLDTLLVSRTILCDFFRSIHAVFTLSASFWLLWGCAGLYIIDHLFFLFPCNILFALPKKFHGKWASNKVLLLFERWRFSTKSINTFSVIHWRRWSLFGSFWICIVFPFIIQSNTLTSSKNLLIWGDSLSWMDGNFSTKIHSFVAWRFPILYFLECCSFFESTCIFVSGTSRASNSFSYYLSIQYFCFFFPPFPYFNPKKLCFFCLRLLICLYAIPINLLVQFSFVIFERLVLLIYLDLIQVAFKYPFFYYYVLIYSSLMSCQIYLWLSFCDLFISFLYFIF